MSTTTPSTGPSSGNDSPTIHLVIAHAWNEGEESPVEVHLLLKESENDDLVQTVLSILADEGYQEAELLEMGTLTEQPDEEPHKSAWETAIEGQVALIEFDGDEEEDE